MIRLEPFAEPHLAAVEALLDDPEMQRFTRIPAPAPPGFALAWLRRYEEGRGAGTREAFAIVDDAGGKFLGLALVPQLDAEGAEAELGYAVAPSARGRGVATAALRLLTEWAFARGVLRAELRIGAENEASKRVAARCGYVREGVLRSAHLKQGIRENVEIWSRLPTDP